MVKKIWEKIEKNLNGNLEFHANLGNDEISIVVEPLYNKHLVSLYRNNEIIHQKICNDALDIKLAVRDIKTYCELKA